LPGLLFTIFHLKRQDINIETATQIYIVNGTNGKWQFPFVCSKHKAEKAKFCLFTANGNGKQKFVFLGRQTINDNRQLLFQQTCQSMAILMDTEWQQQKNGSIIASPVGTEGYTR
jgi:hypothetical protein